MLAVDIAEKRWVQVVAEEFLETPGQGPSEFGRIRETEIFLGTEP